MLYLYPTQIEADLAFRGIDIGDWHRLTLRGGVPVLSSRRLLVLVDALPDTSATKTARRDGDWPLWQKILKETHRELALYRAAKYAGSENEYDPKVFVSPADVREREQEQEAIQEEVDEWNELYDELGWT